MKTFYGLKQDLSRLVLRGNVLQRWIDRKARRLERRYLTELIQRPPSPVASPRNTLAKRFSVRKILFIGDIQWEDDELLPELRNICAVDALNLRPHLQKTPGSASPSSEVCKAVGDFIEANTKLEPDVILFYARSGLLSREVFERLRARWTCPLLGMNLDDKIEFLDYNLFSGDRNNYQEWVRQFDLNITNVIAVTDWYRQQGSAVYYMPEGFHPRSESAPPQSTAQFQHEISFVGNWKPERQVFFDELRQTGMPLTIMGQGWPGSANVKNPAAVYRVSMLNLGVGFASPSGKLTTLKARDFECPGTGACYLTTYNWELASHYEIGREILCYRSAEEAVEMFSYFRRRSKACLKIAQAARRRCLNEHTWEKRFRALFREMGFI